MHGEAPVGGPVRGEEAAAEVLDGEGGVRGAEEDGAEGKVEAGAVVRVEEGGEGPVYVYRLVVGGWDL